MIIFHSALLRRLFYLLSKCREMEKKQRDNDEIIQSWKGKQEWLRWLASTAGYWHENATSEPDCDCGGLNMVNKQKSSRALKKIEINGWLKCTTEEAP